MALGSQAPMKGFLAPLRLECVADSSVARRGGFSMLGVCVQGAVRVLTNVMIGRIGGPAVFGVVAVAISTGQLLALVGPTTIGSAASKFVASARGKDDSVEASAIAAHLAKRAIQATLVLSLAAVPVWSLIGKGPASEAVFVGALLVGYSGYHLGRGLQFGSGQIMRATAWDLFCSTLGLLGVLAALSLGFRGLRILLPLAAANVLYALGNWPWRAQGRPSDSLRKSMDAFIVLGVAGTIASAGFLHLSVIAASLTDGVAQAGRYAAAITLATPPSLVAMSLSLALLPAMSEAVGRGDMLRFRGQTDHALRLLLYVMVPIFGGLIVTSPLLVQIIWGNGYERVATLLPILLIAVLVNMLGVPSVNALTSYSQRGMIVASSANVLGMLIGIAIWALAGRRWGVEAVAFGYLAGTTMATAIPTIAVSRRDGHAWFGLFARALTGIALAVIVGGVVNRTGGRVWLGPAGAGGFIALWLFWMRHRAGPLVSTFLRSISSSAA